MFLRMFSFPDYVARRLAFIYRLSFPHDMSCKRLDTVSFFFTHFFQHQPKQDLGPVALCIDIHFIFQADQPNLCSS